MSKYQVDAGDFDGAKFAKRYDLDPEVDFHAEYDGGGRMFVVLRDGLELKDDPPVFEPPDTTKRDRVTVLGDKLAAGDLTLSEISEYLRLRDGT